MRLEYVGGGSSKFWEGRVVGAAVTVVFGRIGTAGQTRSTKFASPALAKAGLAKLVAEKRGKGYAPAKARPNPALTALATALGGKPAGDLDATIDALVRQKRLAEVDWKEAGSEVLAQLRRVGGKRGLAKVDTIDLDERRTDEALALFGRTLGAAELALLQLDKDSDSFVLLVAAERDVAALARLARAAGTRIIRHDGKNLEKLEAERFRKEKKANTTHPWGKLVARVQHQKGTHTNTEAVLRELLHGQDLAEIRRAAPYAPARERPLIDMVLSFYVAPASRIAATTKQPALALHALFAHAADDEQTTYERLAATAILAKRLKIKPDHGRLHEQVASACNVFASAKAISRALAKLTAAQRELLAELADRYLDGSSTGSSRAFYAMLALEKVGDARSLPRLTEIAAESAEFTARTGSSYARSAPNFVARVMRGIRARG